MAGGCEQLVRDGSVDKLSLSTTKLELGRVRASLRDLFLRPKYKHFEHFKITQQAIVIMPNRPKCVWQIRCSG